MIGQEAREAINTALHRYGATLTADDHIAKHGKVLGITVEIQKGRLRMLGSPGHLIASYPASRAAQGISNFVERFWYWKPEPMQGSRSRRSR